MQRNFERKFQLLQVKVQVRKVYFCYLSLGICACTLCMPCTCVHFDPFLLVHSHICKNYSIPCLPPGISLIPVTVEFHTIFSFFFIRFWLQAKCNIMPIFHVSSYMNNGFLGMNESVQFNCKFDGNRAVSFDIFESI